MICGDRRVGTKILGEVWYEDARKFRELSRQNGPELVEDLNYGRTILAEGNFGTSLRIRKNLGAGSKPDKGERRHGNGMAGCRSFSSPATHFVPVTHRLQKH